MKLPVALFVALCAMISAHAQDSYAPIKATTQLRSDGTTCTTIKDPEKQTWEETISNAAGKVLRRTTYLIGERDLPMAAIFSDSKGALLYKATYKRDGLSRVVETVFNAPDGRYLGKRIFVFGVGDTARVEDYDANGMLIARPQAAQGKPAKGKTFKGR